MRVGREAVARQAGIENGDLAAGTAELQGAGETGKAAADDDDVIHCEGALRLAAQGKAVRPPLLEVTPSTFSLSASLVFGMTLLITAWSRTPRGNPSEGRTEKR